MKKIQVGDTFALVDDEDYDLLTAKGWTWHERDGYAVTKVKQNGRRRQYSMHRYVMQENNPYVIIDHKDRNRMNNQKANLIRSNQKENSNNRCTNVFIEAFGEKKTLAQWCDDDRCAVSYQILRYRIQTGVPPELAILANKGEL